MERIEESFEIFEYATGPKNKKWDENDLIIVIYYYNFGFLKLGISNEEEFFTEYLGTTPDGFKMQCLNIKHLVSGEGLPHFTRTQKNVVNKYFKYSEEKLRKVVDKILDGTTEETKNTNAKFVYDNASARERKRMMKKYFGNKNMSKLDDTDESPFSVGDAVDHVKFGKGEVLDITNNILNIKFEDFTKKLIYKMRFFK